MKKVIDFLTALQQNNDKQWFDGNRSFYREAESEFKEVVERLIPAIASFEPSVSRLSVRDCTYRIYRDIRFSRDKRPYKTYMGAYICPGGKKSGMAGYYFHIEPPHRKDDGSPEGGYLLSPGLYCPEPKVLRSVREEIFDNGAQFDEAIKKAKGFELCLDSSLKRNPAGFPEGPYDKYIRLKDFYLEKSVPEEIMLSDGLTEYAADAFRSAREFVAQLNRAVRYAYEEM